MPPDMQDALDAVGGGEQVVLNNPTEDQVTKQAINEVLASDAKEKAEQESKAKAEKEAKEKAAADEHKDDETQREPEPQEELDEAAKAEKEAKEKEAKEKSDAEAKAKKDSEEKEKAQKRDLELAERMSKLAQQEKRIRAQAEEAKKATEAAETRAKTAEADAAKYKAVIEALETNPIKAFRLAGKDFNKSLLRAKELMSGNPNLMLQEELDAKMEAQRLDFEKKLADDRASREKEKKEEQERQRASFEEQDRHNTVQFIADQVKAGGERWELVSAEGREKEIALELWNHFHETGETIPFAEYLDHVEKQLEGRLADRVLKTNKAKKLLVPATTAQIAAQKKADEEKAKKDAEGEDDPEKDDESTEKTLEREKRRIRKGLTNTSTQGRAAPPTKTKPASTGDIWEDARNEALAYLNGQR